MSGQNALCPASVISGKEYGCDLGNSQRRQRAQCEGKCAVRNRIKRNVEASALNYQHLAENSGGFMATLRVAVKPTVAPMKVAQISKPGGDFEIVERSIPEPDAGQVRIKVLACGVCHSDVLTKEGLWPGIQYPR